MLFLSFNLRRTWQQLSYKQRESGVWAVRLPQTWQKQPKRAALCGAKTTAITTNIINEKNRDSRPTVCPKILHRSPQKLHPDPWAPRRASCWCSCGTPSFRCAASRLPRQRGHRLGEVDLEPRGGGRPEPEFGFCIEAPKNSTQILGLHTSVPAAAVAELHGAVVLQQSTADMKTAWAGLFMSQCLVVLLMLALSKPLRPSKIIRLLAVVSSKKMKASPPFASSPCQHKGPHVWDR